MLHNIKLIITSLLLLPIKIYQIFIAPNIINCCRFVPSCSEYSKKVIQKYGSIKGIWLTIRRLLRCHPWGGNGHDPA